MSKASKINILGMPYKLSFREEVFVEEERVYGYCDAANLELAITSTLPIALRSEVILHEIIEAVDAHLELDLSHAVIQALGVVLSQVIRDNKVIREALVS